MKIVIDGFGGDNSPDEVLKGAALAVKELGIEVAVTGDTEVLKKRMEELKLSSEGMEFVPAEGIMRVEDNPRSILKENSGTSMGVAFKYLAEITRIIKSTENGDFFDRISAGLQTAYRHAHFQLHNKIMQRLAVSLLKTARQVPTAESCKCRYIFNGNLT